MEKVHANEAILLLRSSIIKLSKWWLERSNRMVDPRPMALGRICIMICVFFDLLRAAQEGLVFALYRKFSEGGINRIHSESALWLTDISPEYGGPIAWVICIISSAMAMLGIATRPAMFILVVFYAQLGHLYSPGDRGIDQMLRLCILILICSGSHLRFSLMGKRNKTQCFQWPAQLILLLVVLMYTQAGLNKIGSNPNWILGGKNIPLYHIISDPLSAKLNAVAAAKWMWFWQLSGQITIIFEVFSFLLLTRLALYWATIGIVMHLGIALFMHLGMFSWGMLALYPLILYTWTIRLLDRLAQNPRLSFLGSTK